MTELLISGGKIVGSLFLLAGVLLIASRAPLTPERRRKLVHVSLGIYCLGFPLIFTDAVEVVSTCALAGVIFLFVRNHKLGSGLHAVGRRTYGELYFALAVAALFALAQPANGAWGLTLYLAPLLVLTIADAAAALIGVRYGRHPFTVFTGRKSLEGVLAFVATAWLLSFATLTLLAAMPVADATLLATVVAALGAMLEAASWRGLDNLFVPLGVFGLLTGLAPQGVLNAEAACACLAVASLTIMAFVQANNAARPA